MVIDNGFRHEAKIQTKHLDCLPLSGFNHMAVYIVWAYCKGLLSNKILKAEPRLEETIKEGNDIREIIANSEYMKGKIRSTDFTEEGKMFTEDFYRFESRSGYPRCVDNYALYYFRKKYYSLEFRDEAYLFVPYDENYYKSLSKYINDAWENRNTTEEIIKKSKRRKLTRHELIILVERIQKCQGSEKEIDKMIELLTQNVSDPEISNYIFYEENSPEEVVDKALAYKPIIL